MASAAVGAQQRAVWMRRSVVAVGVTLALFGCANFPREVDTNPAGREQAEEGSFIAVIRSILVILLQ